MPQLTAGNTPLQKVLCFTDLAPDADMDVDYLSLAPK